MYTYRVFGTARWVLFIKVSLFQVVPNKTFNCSPLGVGHGTSEELTFNNWKSWY